MEIKLSKKESEEYFYNSLCNGLSYISGYGLEMKTNSLEYKKAATKLKELKPGETICYEDVFMQILKDGGKLTLVDIENDGDMTKSITLKDVHEKVSKTPLRYLNQMIEEQDDAITADCILQTVFYDDIIFG